MIETKVGNYEMLYKDADIVRTEVFCKEQGTSETIEKDEFDKKAIHTVVYFETKPIVAARMIYKNSEYQIGRLATLKKFRGNGFARLAMESLLIYAKMQGIKEIVLHSQKTAEGFYKKLGFESVGKIYKEIGIDHISMKITF